MSGIERFNNGREYAGNWFGREDVKKIRTFIVGLPDRLGILRVYWKAAATNK